MVVMEAFFLLEIQLKIFITFLYSYQKVSWILVKFWEERGVGVMCVSNSFLFFQGVSLKQEPKHPIVIQVSAQTVHQIHLHLGTMKGPFLKRGH